MRFSVALVVVIATFTLIACGSDKRASAPPETTTAAVAPTKTAEPAPVAKDKPDTSAAVDAVRDGLPDIPLYEGARFKGTVISDTQVCVDTTLTKESGAAVGGNRTSHVVVSFPALSKGEPQDGLCAKREENSDKAIEAGRFFLRMDDYALGLKDAVMAAQDGEPNAVERIAKLRSRILKTVNAYLLGGGETSIGGNLLLSAATTAREAAQAGNVARLADQRREITDARNKLADEAIN